jgi:RNA polymerase sigma-70 factor (ECF subfamily)
MSNEMESVQSMAEEKILLDKLTIAMERDLTEEQKNVIVLRFQEDFSLQETADIIGKNVNAVKALQNRGMINLRQAMGRLDEEP